MAARRGDRVRGDLETGVLLGLLSAPLGRRDSAGVEGLMLGELGSPGVLPVPLLPRESTAGLMFRDPNSTGVLHSRESPLPTGVLSSVGDKDSVGVVGGEF